MKLKPYTMHIWLEADLWKLIDDKAKRDGKTRHEIVSGLVDLARSEPPEKLSGEISWNDDDPRWESQIIRHLVLKHLRVN